MVVQNEENAASSGAPKIDPAADVKRQRYVRRRSTSLCDTTTKFLSWTAALILLLSYNQVTAFCVLSPSSKCNHHPSSTRLYTSSATPLVALTREEGKNGKLQKALASSTSVQTVELPCIAHADGPDLRLTLVDGADHRFSSDDCLALIERSVEDVLERSG